MAKTLTINGHLVRSVALIPGGDVKAIGDGAQTLWEASQPDYFFIENYTQSANTVAFPKTGDAEEWVSLDYSLDGSTWYPYDLETGVSIPAGGKLYLKGDNANLSKSASSVWTTHSFTSTGAILAGGNAVSLLDSTAPATKSVGQFGFACMFAGNTNLLSVDSTMFDGVGMAASYVFYKTFDGCTNLANVPVFWGVTNVTQSSFTQTFRNCRSVTTAAGFLPNAVSTTSALVFQSCFANCTGLVTPPDLSAIVPGAGNSVFIEMFRGCTSLATPAEVYSPVPDVTGTHKLAGMYNGCTSLTRSPRVYIPNPTANILLNTFTGCGSLDLVRVTFDSWGTDGEYTNEWTYGVHSTGVFCKTSSLPVTRNARDAAQSACDYIPYLWSIADQNGKLYAPVFTYDGQTGTMAIAEAEGGQSCEIYYTTDGTTPTPQTGTLYTGAFAVTEGQTVKAISHYSGTSAAYVTDSAVAIYELPVDYFYIENLSDTSNTVTMTGSGTPGLSVSTDPARQVWTAFTPSQGVTLAAGGKAWFRGNNSYISTSSNTRSFTSTGDAAVGGSIYTLLGDRNVSGKVSSSYALAGLFSGWTKLKSAANNLLSRISFGTNATYAFKSMFYGCTSLNVMPDLPASTTRTGVYDNFMENSAACFIKVGFTSWPSSGWTDWTKGLTTYNSSMSAKGVFCCPSSLAKTRNTYSSFMPSMAKYNNIPIGWSIADENGKLYAPTISFNDSTMKCTIAEYSSGKSCKIYYTTDGTTPTPQNGTLYSAAFSVEFGTTVKAMAHYDGTGSEYVTDSDAASSVLTTATVFVNTSESDVTVALPKTGDAEEWLDLKCRATGDTEWTAFDPEAGATVPAGGQLAIKYNTAVTGGTGLYDEEGGMVTYHTFNATGPVELKCVGYLTGASTSTHNPATPYHYYRLFYNCSNITGSEIAVPMSNNADSAHACESMFEGCSLIGSVVFDGTYGSGAANVYTNMFKGCTSLTSVDFHRYFVSAEPGESAYESMFEGCTSLTTVPGLGRANTLSSQRIFYRMFYGCTSLATAPEMPSASGGLVVTGSNVFGYMFYNCTALTAAPALNVATPDTQCFAYMFCRCGRLTTAADITIGAAASHMCDSMFAGCSSLTTLPTLPTATADYSYRYMFKECTALTSASSLTFTGASTYCFCGMFEYCTNLTELPSLSSSVDTNSHQEMFSGCTSLTDASSLTFTSSANNSFYTMFKGCTRLTAIPTLSTSVSVHSHDQMFMNCTSLTDASSLTFTSSANYSFYGMFSGCTRLTAIPTLSSSVSSYSHNQMFMDCTSLTDASSITIGGGSTYCCKEMFRGCTRLVNPPSITGSTIGTDAFMNMFLNCTLLATVPSFTVSTVNTESCYNMFSGCTSLTSAGGIHLDATSVGSSSYRNMFEGCSALVTPPSFTSSSLTVNSSGMGSMFKNCTSLTTAPSFTISASGAGDYCCNAMFDGCTSLTTASGIHLNATAVGADSYRGMFNGCTVLTAAPAFTASNLTVNNNGMREMFRDCTALATAPSFKAHAFASGTAYSATKYTYCLDNMFSGCTSLTDASGITIDAPLFTQSACSYMFKGCTSLVNPPYITGPATNGTLTSQKIWANVLAYMFNRCTSLDMIRLTLAEWSRSSTNFTNAWTYQTSEYGVFCRSTIAVTRNASGATEANCDYIPYKWSTANYSGKLDAPTVSGSASSVTISEANSGQSCQLYYTTDGTAPTPQNGTLYAGAFAVEAGTTVKAIAHYAGASSSRITDSSVVSKTF